MQHEWIAGGQSAKNYDLHTQQEKIKKYQANRRFRKVAFAVIAINRAKFLTFRNKMKRATAKAKAKVEEKQEDAKEQPEAVQTL